MTASAFIVSNNNKSYHSFNEKCHCNPIFTSYSTSKESQHQHEKQQQNCHHFNENSGSLSIMPYIYDLPENMTAMTNGISSTSGGAPIIEITKSPTKNDKAQNNNQHAQGVYREKDPNQHAARGKTIINIDDEMNIEDF